MKRRESRQIILQALYQLDVTKSSPEEAINFIIEEQDVPDNELDFVKELVFGTINNMEKIDQLISQYLKGWTLSRLSNIDRNILRMSVYELLHKNEDELSVNVIVNEAVELAKSFGTDDSPKFINGVLGSIVKANNDLEK